MKYCSDESVQISCELKTHSMTNVHFIVKNMAEGLAFLSCAAPKCYSPPAQLSRGFLKPSSDDEDSVPSWKKSSRPVQEVNSVKKQQEKEMGLEKNSYTGAVSLERFCNLTRSVIIEVYRYLTDSFYACISLFIQLKQKTPSIPFEMCYFKLLRFLVFETRL